jgi:hypothetical protein
MFLLTMNDASDRDAASSVVRRGSVLFVSKAATALAPRTEFLGRAAGVDLDVCSASGALDSCTPAKSRTACSVSVA